MMMDFLRRACLALAAFALVASGAAAPRPALAGNARPHSGQAYQPALVPGRCPFPMPEGEIDGATIQCGTMSVPQDRAKPQGYQVKIAYAVLKSHRRHPQPDALIHLHGGPGGGSLPFIETGAQVFDQMREDRDIVLFDQRGAGYSRPDLNCYNLEFQVDEQADLDIPAGMSERQARTLASCASAFAGLGVDLTQYNTAENAKDVVDLAQALGLKAYNLSGVSYGTRLAQEIMRLSPNGLRSVILDSSLSPATKAYEDFYAKGWETLQGIFADCAADAACNKAFPNLPRRAAALVKKLDASPARVVSDTLDFELTGYLLLKPLILSHDVPQVAPYVPLMIDEVERGAYDTYLAISQGTIPPLPGEERASEPQPLAPQSPAGKFDAAVVERINDLPEEDGNHLRAAYYGLFGPIQGRATLRDFVVRNFNGADAAALLSILAGLSDGELEDLYRANKPITGSSRELGVFKTFECHDSYPYNRYDRVVRNAGGLPFAIPQDVLESTRLTMEECRFWPTGVAAPIAVQPVRSGLPVLILHGRHDFVTPLSWSKQVQAALRNSRLVEVGQAGHGVLKYSACARDLAAQFLGNPKAGLDTRCVASTAAEFRAR